jgi:O-antigen/teichoic acid export membrane protein
MVVSIILSLIVPKLLGVEQYGYWQLYTFYVSYIGFFHFGWADGLYLRYGGKYYDDLDKSLMHSQYWLLAFLEMAICLGISVLALFLIKDSNKTIILIATGFNCVLILPRTILEFLLQSTGRVKEYARNTILERLLYASLILGFLVVGYQKYEFMLLADIIAKTVAMIGIAWVCRDIVFTKGVKLSLSLAEGWRNISVGAQLLIANIAGMLIIGIVRFSIERVWDITTFGKVSFSLSISNLVLTFIAAVSIVIFPLIKRSDQSRLPVLYETVGTLLSALMIVFLILYYPIKVGLTLWLPHYVEAIGYFSILFPLSLFEARSSLLINTYLKALREERAMLYLNGLSVGLSLVVTGITVFWLENLTIAIISIVFLQATRCFIPDLFLQKKMHMKYSYEVLWDVLAAIVFITGNWAVGGMKGWGIYCTFVIFLMLFRMRDYKSHLQIMYGIIR